MSTIESIKAAAGEYRAGSTDLQKRLRSGVTRGTIVDLTGLPELNEIGWDEHGRARIGALVPIVTIASDPRLRAAYPGLALSAGALATPQIRAAGTLGGNLLQHNRCWYYRNPATNCLKKGGDSCPARAGNHLYGVCFDLGPCVAPHPSTLAMALLAHDAEIEVDARDTRPIAALYGDGSDARRDPVDDHAADRRVGLHRDLRVFDPARLDHLKAEPFDRGDDLANPEAFEVVGVEHRRREQKGQTLGKVHRCRIPSSDRRPCGHPIAPRQTGVLADAPLWLPRYVRGPRPLERKLRQHARVRIKSAAALE